MNNPEPSYSAPGPLYAGLWAILVRWLKVPAAPPSLPVAPGAQAESFRPAPAFLSYLKLGFWISAGAAAFAAVVIVVASSIARWWLGLVLIVPVALAFGTPLFISYVALHLRFDSTWYVMSDRSMRLRRGIWSIQEATITFENVQEVQVSQGPIQRYFGIADVVVHTAGGGSGGGHGKHGGESAGAGHVGLIEGIADAPRLRDLISTRLQRSKSAGLGDESADHTHPATRLSPDHVAELKAIRDVLARLAPA